MGLILKVILLPLSGLFFGAVALGAFGVFLAVTGSPATCSDRDIAPISEAVAAQLDERWAQFSAQLLSGASSIDITEVEATSRARRYVADEGVPIENLRIYFCGDGTGQIAGEVRAMGIDVDFVATGRLDINEARPAVRLESVDVGNLPGFVSEAVLDLLLDENARTLALDQNLVGSVISDGLIVISGEP